jgi:transposase
MSRGFHFEIKESQGELLVRMKAETNVRKKERLQFLYWYQSGLAITRERIAKLLGKSLSVITKWMRRYMDGGLKKLLTMDYQGRKASRKIPVDAVEELVIKLKTPEGFGSFHEIKKWLKEEYNIELAYSTVHKLVKYDLDSSPKVVRPFSEKQNPAMVEDFKENISKPLMEIVKPCLEKYKKIRYWVRDETRVSLKTGLRRRITMGVGA